jgi:acetyl-CoA carboxylase carboxyl transferase subunit alpha
MTNEAELHLRSRLSRLRGLGLLRGTRISGELSRLQRQLEKISEASDEEIWQHVELARHPERPYTLDYVERLFGDFVELHGDRARAEDPAMITGLGRFAGQTVALLGHQKGRDTHERIRRNYGMTYPEGYRKAMRLMDLAERHRFPIVSLVDTPGAYPGVAAEQHGQGGAIARSQALMSRLTVPIVACIIGEGGSGGAIAIALADRVLMQENAMYSVISPEGCAAILWRDGGEKVKAAAALKPDAANCLTLGVIDAVVPEPEAGAQEDWNEAARLLSEALQSSLEDLQQISGEELRRRRRTRFRSLGVFAESTASTTVPTAPAPVRK